MASNPDLQAEGTCRGPGHRCKGPESAEEAQSGTKRPVGVRWGALSVACWCTRAQALGPRCSSRTEAQGGAPRLFTVAADHMPARGGQKDIFLPKKDLGQNWKSRCLQANTNPHLEISQSRRLPWWKGVGQELGEGREMGGKFVVCWGVGGKPCPGMDTRTLGIP